MALALSQYTCSLCGCCRTFSKIRLQVFNVRKHIRPTSFLNCKLTQTQAGISISANDNKQWSRVVNNFRSCSAICLGARSIWRHEGSIRNVSVSCRNECKKSQGGKEVSFSLKQRYLLPDFIL